MNIGVNIRSSWAFKKGPSAQGHDELRIQTRQPINIPTIWITWWFASEKAELTVNDCTHSHSAESPLLSEIGVLSVSDCQHSHVCESPVLIEIGLLNVDNCVHNQLAEEIILLETGILSIQDAVHQHLAEQVVLIEKVTLMIQDALHEHFAESPTIEDLGWCLEFIMIPEEYKYKYDKNTILWWWGIDSRTSKYDGFVMPEYIIEKLDTTPLIKDQPEAIELKEELQGFETTFLNEIDF